MNMIPTPAPTRRRFLQAAGVALALPWLESLAPAGEPDGRGQQVRRLVTVCTGFGLYGPSFFPAQPGRDYQASEYLSVLAELRDSFTVFSGISHPDIGGDHASEACFLTSAKHPTAGGFRNTISLDWQAAQHSGSATRIPLLILGTDDAFPLTHTASGAGVPGLNQPSQVFARLFLNGGPDEVAGEVARLHRGESILDRMGARFAALQPRLGAGDRQQLADYTEAVRDMEKQLHADEAWAMRPKPASSEPAPTDAHDKSDTIGRAAAMFNLARLALQTDSTRVVSHLHPRHGPQAADRGRDRGPPRPHPPRPQPRQDRAAAHRRAGRDGGLPRFPARAARHPDGDGTLLDRTQVLIGSNLGDASGHGTATCPSCSPAAAGSTVSTSPATPPRTRRWGSCSSACCNVSASKPLHSVPAAEPSTGLA